MSDVFISYARTTAAHARFAADALRAAGFSVWFDEQLPTHRAYSDVIAEEIAQAKAVLVIWSKDAIQSQWVRAEADRARGEGKLVQSSIERVQLPMPFDQIHCADLQDWRGDLQTAAWASVLGSISHLAGKKRLAAETTTPESERRRLTVLSCTLVDGAKLAGTLDPEDWLDVSSEIGLRVQTAEQSQSKRAGLTDSFVHLK